LTRPYPRAASEPGGCLEGEWAIKPAPVEVARLFEERPDAELDFGEVQGQESAMCALEIRRPAGTSGGCARVPPNT
jgi:hypothetical protein